MNAIRVDHDRALTSRSAHCRMLLTLIGLLAVGCASLAPSHNSAGAELGARRPFSSAPAFRATGQALDRAAGETDGETAGEGQHDAISESGEEEQRNMLALFLGVTHKDDEDGGSIGIEYERKFSELVGIGLLFESTPSLDERLVGMPMLFLHPIGDLGIMLAPGVEYEDSDWLWLFRVGVSWDFPLGDGFSLAPEINYDFVDGSDNATIVGIALGYEF